MCQSLFLLGWCGDHRGDKLKSYFMLFEDFLKAVRHSLSHICRIGLRPVVVSISYIVE